MDDEEKSGTTFQTKHNGFRMYSSKKYPHLPVESQWKFQGGGGWQKQKFLKKSMELN